MEEDLKRLLDEYGPPNRTTPAYPFHHLVSDGVWEVRTDHGPGSPGSGDGRIGAVPVGLEAAHVRWWAFDGPDDVDNGVFLCSLHHKLFDKGVLGIGDGHRILVSQRFVGHSPAAREQVTALAGRPLIGPQPGAHPVAAMHAPGTPARSSTAGHAPPPPPDPSRRPCDALVRSETPRVWSLVWRRRR